MTTLIPQYDLKNGGSTPTGAINRPINQKLQEIVSVKDFGAKGDGATDDTVAIQAAINYLNPYVYSSPMNYNQGGGEVYFPKGNYLVSSTITLPNNVILTGTGCETYQANLTATNPAQGSTIFAASSFTGSFVIDTAGYDSSGVRYTSSAIPASFNTLTFAEGCGIRDLGVVNTSTTILAGIRILGAPVAKFHNVSCNGFPTSFLSIFCSNSEYQNLFSISTQIGLCMIGDNVMNVSGAFDNQVIDGVGNGVTSGNKPIWWDSIDTVYGSTSIYMISCHGIEFSSISTQHGVRGIYSNESSFNAGAWYAEDFTLTNPQNGGYITGAALINANNGSTSTTPNLTTTETVGVIGLLYTGSNGNTIADSIYNSSITFLGIGQPNTNPGLGILYGSYTSTGQQLYLGAGVLRNASFPDTAFDARLISAFATQGTFTPTYGYITGTVSSSIGKWIYLGNKYDVTITLSGTSLVSSNGIIYTPFNNTNGFAAPARNSIGAIMGYTGTSIVTAGTALMDTDANLYIGSISSCSSITITFTVFVN